MQEATSTPTLGGAQRGDSTGTPTLGGSRDGVTRAQGLRSPQRMEITGRLLGGSQGEKQGDTLVLFSSQSKLFCQCFWLDSVGNDLTWTLGCATIGVLFL